MSRIKEVVLIPKDQPLETIGTEFPGGLQYAIIWRKKAVLAVFGDRYWASRFRDRCLDTFPPDAVEIREVAE